MTPSSSYLRPKCWHMWWVQVGGGVGALLCGTYRPVAGPNRPPPPPPTSHQVLPQDLFPNGKAYFESTRRMFAFHSPCTQCVIVHNNWVVGTAAKVYRCARHWERNCGSPPPFLPPPRPHALIVVTVPPAHTHLLSRVLLGSPGDLPRARRCGFTPGGRKI
jgi:hypothetical protein